MTSYPETLTVKKLIKTGFFVVKISYISSSIFVYSCTIIRYMYTPVNYQGSTLGFLLLVFKYVLVGGK